jgi:hypothetical protein
MAAYHNPQSKASRVGCHRIIQPVSLRHDLACEEAKYVLFLLQRGQRWLAMALRISADSVLFITLDSCRYDTLCAASAPNIKGIAPVFRAKSPSYYTYGSHSAMFVGFTPGIAELRTPILNPKFGKLFKLVDAGFPGKGTEGYQLQGPNIISGFKQLGFHTLGTGAVGWFNPAIETGRHLTESFDEFYYPGNGWSLEQQVEWIFGRIEHSEREQVFVFANIGETHVPYYYRGAAWSADDNPCVPFQTVNRAAECRERQRACCEFVDATLRPLISLFENSTVLVCGDHGDCWGEDGLWEHGVSHEATLTVPLCVRLRGAPVLSPCDALL